jgi:hypothetical protein
MPFGIVVVAAVLSGPALAQTSPTPPATAPAGQAALDRDCRAGNAAACNQASGHRGSARDRAGSNAVPQVNDAAKDANPTPRYSGEGGGMPAPAPAPNRR